MAMNGRRRRRHYRRNPVLPVSWNPSGASSDNLIGRFKGLVNVDFWKNTALPAAGGYWGSKLVGNQVWNLVMLQGPTGTNFASMIPTPAIPFAIATVNTITGGLLAWGVGKINRKWGDMVWVGTILASTTDLIRTLMLTYLPTQAAQIGLSGLGADLTSAMKENIAKRIQAGMHGGMGAYLTKGAMRTNTVHSRHTHHNVNGVGAYLTKRELRKNTMGEVGAYLTDRELRKNTSYAPGPGGSMRSDLADYDVANSDTTF
jgi:hypothetical protein